LGKNFLRIKKGKKSDGAWRKGASKYVHDLNIRGRKNEAMHGYWSV
jgi:hypothetical protein